jgi:uncharacterized membrane protein YdjX (TVP38/TMEM64 family)
MKLLLLVLIALSLFVLLFFWNIETYFNPEHINNWLTDAGGLAPLIYVLVMAMAVVISPIPSLPLNIAAGAFFGPFMGTLYSATGALGGAVISFMIARLLGREIIERFISGHINFCSTCSDKLLTKIIFLSRLLPFFSFDIISYGAGLTKITLRNFGLATFFGMLPLTFAYNYFGSALFLVKGVTVILGLIMVILFFVMPYWIEKRDLFSMRKMFQHITEGAEPDG